MNLYMDVNASNWGYGFNIQQARDGKTSSATQNFFQNMKNTAQGNANKAKVQEAYDQLSEYSKKVLLRIKNRQSVSEADYAVLGNDLINTGAISKMEMDKASGHLIPISKLIGRVSHFQNNNRPYMAQVLQARINGEDMWQGDPLSMMDNWLEALGQMRLEKDERNQHAYDTEQIDDFIAASNKVKELLNSLIGLL